MLWIILYRKKLKLCFERGKDDFVELRNQGTDCTVISDKTLIVCLKSIGLLYGEVISNLNHLPGTSFLPRNTW